MLVQAGASDTGKRFAARVAEVIFTSHPSMETAAAFRREMHDMLAAEGRSAASLKVMTAITPIIGRTRTDAEALQKELNGFIPNVVAISKLEGLLLHFNLSPYPADGPLPHIPSDAPSSIRDRVVDLARRENLLIAELAGRVAAGRTSRTIVGTAQDVADELEAWYSAGAADGFVISPPFLPAALDDFVDEVVPILQEKGVFRRVYEGRTLRDNLGLARPANLFGIDPALGGMPEIW